MITKLHTKILVLSVFALLLAGCQMAGQAAPAQLSAVETVETFYTEYLDYIGDPAGEFRNPMVDRIYRDSEFLSEAFIRKVDDTLASFGQGGGYDPFLMAQDIPQEIQVEAGETQDTVIVRRCFGESWQDLSIKLVQQEGRWLIDDISRLEQ